MKFPLKLIVSCLALVLTCCANQRGIDHEPRANTREIDAAFRQLNDLQRQAVSLHGLLDQYIFYAGAYLRAHSVVREFLIQVLAALEAELGDYVAAEARYAQPAVAQMATVSLPDVEHFSLRPADDTIVEMARDRRIVLINEAHHIGETRLLTSSVLPRLRALGFTHFAAEGIDERDVDLVRRGYPTAATGPYINDPLYAEIVRRAIELGFTVVAYESTNAHADAQTREEDQAQHLFNRVFGVDPQARLIVHAGYAHIHKRKDEFFTDTMAMRLQRKTGFDPLSIDQTVLRPRPTGASDWAYRDLTERWSVQNPSVFFEMTTHAAWSLNPDAYDISVILPPTIIEHGRPMWLKTADRRSVKLDMPAGEVHFPWLIEARYAAESDDAVPADRFLLREPSRQAVLFLRPGEYRLRIQASDKRLVEARDLHVAAAPTP